MTTVELEKNKEIIKQMESMIKEDYFVKKVLLFGSYAYGVPDSDSDADIFIIVDDGMDTRKYSVDIRTKIRKKFGYDLPLDIIIKTEKEVSERLALGDYFVKDVINKGAGF